mmetsp:Transcript_28585/g.35062  ORF Transcript_28585/g.35062 Transcript_28585/m.35062 type:complete len:399 (-) Transcript_28585:92-1288(-)|eukprot:CAMPEP_0204830498 /NCGR_PEP_ID=MMETSP1346-20131115/8711_1 /ASSEMBLY_ACC=CAM_ASM_000771 /TAXON_ID=215587 /ORGANISM="Aplanochytrium stocchinoi, Strain GSBS06" /LENGTH=398 /DNA_ID=CAMNT_0051960797 /DNA_START=44 /DNA_END=1240 /DNA_ORIENTATION=-
MEAVKNLFLTSFGSGSGLENTVCVVAPGRVNLIGEHTDYQEGYVMPLAIEYKTTIIARKNGLGDTCRIVSAQQNNKVEEFLTTDLKPGERKWIKYVQGVIAEYQKDIKETVCFDAAISSSVPQGGGLSSSASLEVATASMLEALYEIDSVSPTEKALRCVEAEHIYAKVPCGIMDQFASTMATKDNALLIDCRSRLGTPVPLDDSSIAIVVANSNAPHELTGSEYSDRVDQCNKSVEFLQQKYPEKNIKSLRDVNFEEIEAVRDELDEIIYKRALHVITENDRVLKALEASRDKKHNIFGKLMVASHCSLRDNFEVSTFELDCLVEIAIKVNGVYGSRMTGGGFGGCTVSLVKKDSVPLLLDTLKEEYKAKTNGKECTCFVTSACQGTHVVWTNGNVQ